MTYVYIYIYVCRCILILDALYFEGALLGWAAEGAFCCLLLEISSRDLQNVAWLATAMGTRRSRVFLVFASQTAVRAVHPDESRNMSSARRTLDFCQLGFTPLRSGLCPATHHCWRWAAPMEGSFVSAQWPGPLLDCAICGHRCQLLQSTMSTT